MTTYSLTKRPKGSCIVLAVLWGTAVFADVWRAKGLI